MNLFYSLFLVVGLLSSCGFLESRTETPENTYVIFDRFKIIDPSEDDPSSGHQLVYDHGDGLFQNLQSDCIEVAHNDTLAYIKYILRSDTMFGYLKLELNSPSKGSLEAIYENTKLSEVDYKRGIESCSCKWVKVRS